MPSKTESLQTDASEVVQSNGELGMANVPVGGGGPVEPETKPKKAKVQKGLKRIKAKVEKSPKPTPKKSAKAKVTPAADLIARKVASEFGDPNPVKKKADKGREVYRAAQMLKMVSEASRVAIVLMLSENGPMNVNAICQGVGQGQPATSHHLALLRHSGVVVPSRQGKNNFYSLSEQGESLAGLIKKLIVVTEDRPW